MRLWLIVPPRPRDQTLNLRPPLGLGYLATACRRGGHDVRILDATLEDLPPAAVVAMIREERPPVVGFSIFTSDLDTVTQLCREIKRLPRPPLLLLGGIHPSSAPEETLGEVPDADYLFAGEAEVGLPQLLSLLERQEPLGAGALAAIPGLGWRSPEGAKINPRIFPEDVDALGLPAWDLLRPLRYQAFMPTLFVRQRPYVPIIATRGCPYHCTYCGGHNVSGRRPRQRSVNHVLEEIGFLRREYGIRELHIEDENFTLDRDWVVEFCERLIGTGWNMTWTMPNGVRVDTLDLELLRLMKRAGCYLLVVGVESGSDRVLAHMRKGLTVRTIEEKTALIRQAGILAHGLFMVGYPAETPADCRATRELALRLPLIGAQFSNFRPLPGTACAESLLAGGEITSFPRAARESTFAAAVYAPRGMTIGEVKAWQRRMLASFYFRPRVLGFYLREALRNPSLLPNLLRRVRLYLFRRT